MMQNLLSLCGLARGDANVLPCHVLELSYSYVIAQLYPVSHRNCKLGILNNTWECTAFKAP